MTATVTAAAERSVVEAAPTELLIGGGVKASGFGREGGREGIEEYLATRYVAVDRA